MKKLTLSLLLNLVVIFGLGVIDIKLTMWQAAVLGIVSYYLSSLILKRKDSKEIGVLLLELPAIGKAKPYHFLYLHQNDELPEHNYFTISITFLKERVISGAYKCTRKQAEQFSQFKWVSLTKL
ncbi:TPA: hypothetical protein ACISM1_001725 [Streptococcus pyogenes]